MALATWDDVRALTSEEGPLEMGVGNFSNFSAFVEEMQVEHSIFDKGARKMRPPRSILTDINGGAHPNPGTVQVKQQIIRRQQKQHLVYNVSEEMKGSQPFSDYVDLGSSGLPEERTPDVMEEFFWSSLRSLDVRAEKSFFYASGIAGTKTPPEFQHLFPDFHDVLMPDREYTPRVEGITNPYLYYGSSGSCFPSHCEDSDCLAVSFLRYGGPKLWYVVPPDSGREYEKLVARCFKNEFSACSAFLRHKTVLLDPRLLVQEKIPFRRIIQRPGDMIVVMPYR